MDDLEGFLPGLTKQDLLVLISAASAALMVRSFDVTDQISTPEQRRAVKEDRELLEGYLLLILTAAPSHVLRFVADSSAQIVENLKKSRN